MCNQCGIDRKWSLLSFSFITISLVAGIIYGYPALRRDLLNDGSTLDERVLGGVYTTGSWTTQGGRFLFGIARDRYGTKRVTCLSLLCVIIGSLGFAFSGLNETVALVASAFFVGCGSGVQLCLQPVAGLFVKNSSMVISSLSGAFNISGLVFLGLTSLPGVQRRGAFTGYAVLVFGLSIIALYILPRGASFLIDEEIVLNTETELELDEMSDTKINSEDLTDGTKELNVTSVPQSNDKSALAQMKTLEFFLLCTWFCVAILPLQYYVGTIGYQLENKGDASGFYTNIFSVAYASAAILTPFGGYLADKVGVGVVQGIATMASSISFFFLASESSLNVQVVGMVFYGIGRTSVFGMFFANIGKRFGYANYGTLVGFGLLLSGIISLLQYPLIALTVGGYDLAVNISCGMTLILTTPYCIWLGSIEHNERKNDITIDNPP